MNPIAEQGRPHVAIVLVNWNNWRDCTENLDSLLAQTYSNFHVFVVDNDSRDQSIEHMADWCSRPRADAGWRNHDGVDRWTNSSPDGAAQKPIAHRVVDHRTDRTDFLPAARNREVTLIRSGGNLGFAGGCNVGIRRAAQCGYEYFWLLNTDTVIHRDALSALVERATEDSHIGMVGSTVLYYDRPDVVQALGGAHLDAESGFSRHIGEGQSRVESAATVAAVESQLSYVFGASLLVSAKLVREIGCMREDYFLYFEEIDWALRARDSFKMGYAPESLIFHKAGGSSSKAMPLFSANYYYRNLLRFMSRFYPQQLGVVKRRLTREVIRCGLKGQWSRARLVGSILLDADNIAAQAIASVK